MLASSRPLGTGSIDPLDPSHPDYSSNTAPEVAPFEFYPDPSSKTVYTAPFVTPDTRHEGLIPVTDFDGGEYAAPVVEAKKGKTILGLKKRTFIIVAVVLAVLVIIGVVIGVVMGLQNKASVEDGGLVGSSQAGGSKDSTATGTATASARISAQPRPTVAAKALGTNATFMEGSFFSGTSSADDKVRSSEAWTFYQDVDKVIIQPPNPPPPLPVQSHLTHCRTSEHYTAPASSSALWPRASSRTSSRAPSQRPRSRPLETSRRRAERYISSTWTQTGTCRARYSKRTA